jgi:Toprim-like/CHC2 zinc finger
MKTQEAKRIPISQFLAALGHAPVKEGHGEKWYFSPFREETTASFKLSADERAWYDHGVGAGGNILDLAMQLFNVSLVDALHEIERLVGSPTLRAAAAGQYSLLERDKPLAGIDPAPVLNTPVMAQEGQSKRGDAFTDVTIKAVTDGRLLRYLQERAIPPLLAREYLQEIRYTYHEKRYFALAFPNDSNSYEMRNQYYQGVFGKKTISTLHLSQSPPSVAVFEGVFDFLSAMVWDKSAMDGAVIVMNSVAMKAQTLAQIRQIGAPLVNLYLDHDRAGKTLTAEMQQELSGVNVVDCSGLYAGYKDFNEFLQAQRHSTKKGGILT